MSRQTWLEIDISAIGRNVALLRARIPKPARLMAVVKADGYGHGAVQVAEAALENGADFLGVALPEEGARLRMAGIAAPILVLGGILPEGAEAVRQYGLTQAVFDVQAVRALADEAARAGKTIDVHIKVDSGMGRVGVRDASEMLRVYEAIQAQPALRLTGVFTHFADATNEDLAFAREQAGRFLSIARFVKARHPEILLHAANSAAALRCPELAMDMVRTGIALYIDPGLPGEAGAGLSGAMRWVTRAVHVKEIQPGETVGYGRTFTAALPTRVMTLPVGYADGYHRVIGGQGWALVRGRRATVIGRVCMDQMMVDVSHIKDAAVGEEAVLLGRQGGECITVREMAGWCGMIDYEILLSPTARVPRVYRT